MIFKDFLPVHLYFYLSKTGFTFPNDGWTGLCINPCTKLHQRSPSFRTSLAAVVLFSVNIP